MAKNEAQEVDTAEAGRCPADRPQRRVDQEADRPRQEARHHHRRRAQRGAARGPDVARADRGRHVRAQRDGRQRSSRTTRSADDDEEDDKEPEAAAEDEVDPLDDGGPRPAAAVKKEADRPHRRSGPHVPARDGRGGIALPRGRDRHRQAHRGRPRHDDLGPVRKPDHLQRHHRLVERAQRRRACSCARSSISRRCSSKGPTAEQIAEAEEGGEDAEGEISEKVAGPSIKEEEEVADEPEADANEDDEDMVERRTQPQAEDDDEDNTLSLAQMEETAKAAGAREIRRDHLDLQEVLQGPGAPHGRARRRPGLRRRRGEEVPEAARAAHRRGRERPVPRRRRSNISSSSSTPTTAA